MTTNYKRIAKNTLFLYFRMIIIMGVSFFTVRIVLDTLGVIDYGIYGLASSLVMMMAFLNTTLSAGTQRFLTFSIGRNDLVKLQETFSTALMIHIALALLVFILSETVGLWFLYEKMNIPADRFYAAFWVYQFATFSIMVSVTQVPYNALIIAHEKMKIFAYISIIEVILKLFLVYLLYISSYDKLITYAILMFMVLLLITFIYRRYAYIHYKESHFKFIYNKKLLVSMLYFSGWNIFGTLGTLLSNQGTNILLNIFSGPATVTARVISMQVSDGLAQFSNGFQQAITPQITKLYATDQLEELNKLLYQNSKYAFLLLWLLALPVLVQLDYVLNLWLKEVPEHTVLFCQLVILHGLIISLNRPYSRAIHATGNMKQTNISAGVIFLLVIPISYLFLKQGYSIVTPFYIYIGATILNFIIELYYLKQWINTSVYGLFINTLFPITLVSITSIIIVYEIENLFDNSFLKVIFITIFSISIVFILTYVFALNGAEKKKFGILIKKKLQID